MTSEITKNIEDIKRRVEKAAIKSGRKFEDIKIIAVTKTIDSERINEVLDENILDLGENRVQEICRKYDEIKRPCNWHMIGHLQTNKVKYIINKVAMIHSLDSFELAQELQKRAKRAGISMDVLVEVNVSGEISKYGIAPKDVLDFIKKASVFPNIKIKGLMTIAPNAQNTEDIRMVFKEIYKIFLDIRKENINNIDINYISAGMSNDFEVAIEEGANIVRVGTSIFGKRN
ncbi:MAG: YggS family pyridoxal phosphate-dependent enzyme [Clostridia bacterium]|jgi:hypothetical protein